MGSWRRQDAEFESCNRPDQKTVDGEGGGGRRSGREELGGEKGIYTCGSRASTLQITRQQAKLAFLPESSVSQDFLAAYRDVSLCESARG